MPYTPKYQDSLFYCVYLAGHVSTESVIFPSSWHSVSSLSQALQDRRILVSCLGERTGIVAGLMCKGVLVCDTSLRLAWPIGGGLACPACPVALDGSAQVQSQGYS
jgi:hypothetical protein